MEVGKGFLQLQEDYSRRSSLHPTIGDASIFAYATRVGCCGCCSIKVERDEDRFRIGRLSLAPYCHLALLVFGLCFLLAGAVLTGLAYSHPQQHAPLIYSQLKQGEDSQEERVAGPLFLVVGLGLLALGVGLAMLGCKLERAAARQRSAMSRFSFESGGSRSVDIFANLDDIRSQGGDSSHRRGSFFGSSFNQTRRSTLSTIAQAVPLGFFMTESPRTPKTPTTVNPPTNNSTTATTKLSDEFQEVELGSPTRDDEFTLPALTLRPSIIPIPMFLSSNRLSAGHHQHEIPVPSRSDEPFGSIASLSGPRGSIASFPAPRFTAHINNVAVPETNGLPPIHVMGTGNALTASPKQGARPKLRATKSEDRPSFEGDILNVSNCSTAGTSSTTNAESQRRPHSGS
ncbi:uncharacterized protein LOC118438725 [Folsomia candida]|uniref:uncharacterized protein LOC118438725 n=1 Tax=Folsomia candida TaxID=158441 RepID=UPI001604D909|nr:uncharacterized protein LOC118438725 [Folsomia candida]